MEPSLTVVLPIHNAERSLRRDVGDVLEAAAELTPRIEVLIVDDASTDDSFEAANELAHEFPQVNVIRRANRRDLTETLRAIRASIRSDVVIVHDGASRVNPDQLRLIWRQQQVLGAVRDAQAGAEGVSFADLRRPSMTQAALETAHRRLWGFQRMMPFAGGNKADVAAEPTPMEQPAVADDDNLRTDKASAPAPARRGVGAIPSLPRTNVFGSISDFARGE